MITIGMVLYNEEKHLSLIESNLKVLCQEGQKISVIVVNNASNDKTGERLRDLAVSYSFKIFERSENNMGSARQDIIDLAQTEWVGFIDGDCVVGVTWVDAVLRRATFISKDIAAFGGPWNPAGKYKPYYEVLFASPMGHFSLPQFSFENDEAFVAHIPTANIIYRKSHVLDVGGFHSKFRYVGEDLDLNCRLRGSGKKLLMVSDMPVDHYLPERIGDWSNKIFTYGRGRVQVACTNKKFLDRILFLPMAFLISVIVAIVTGNSWFLAMYALVVAIVSLISMKRAAPHKVWILIVCTHFSYALGMAFEWIVVLLPNGEKEMRVGQRLRIRSSSAESLTPDAHYIEKMTNR